MVLRVRCQPNSSCCKIGGVFVGADGVEWLKINLVSVPEKGRANQELIKFLATEFKIAKTALVLVSGETDRYKKIRLPIDRHALEVWLKEI